MEEVNKTVEVATDTNIIRHTTPRRYLIALEEMQGHRVNILPMVDSELHVQLVIQARKYIHRLCKKNDGISNEVRRSAIRAAGEAVTDWWKGEHGRNDSIYYFVESLGDDRYSKHFLDLPDEAFKNENGRDQIIYTQAWGVMPESIHVSIQGLIWVFFHISDSRIHGFPPVFHSTT